MNLSLYSQNPKYPGFLSSSTLKIFACIFMLIDHIGAELYPELRILRIIGRLSFPIFAFFIAEGCKYTKNKTKRFLMVFILGIICEAAYICTAGEYYGNILITFSISMAIIFGIDSVKKNIFERSIFKAIFSALTSLSFIFAAYIFSQKYGVDYGFFGVMCPVFAALSDYKEGEHPKIFKHLDNLYVKLAALAIGLLIMSYNTTSLQMWCLLSIPILAVYNGKAGHKKLKYWFYLFYPSHLVIIRLVSILLNNF